MIHVEDVTARARLPRGPKIGLGPVSFTLETPASYALLGTLHDGVDLLLALLAGSERPHEGKITIAGNPASRRPDVAYVPFAPDLPTALSVNEYLSLAAHVRGEPKTPASERLSILGVAPLGPRRIDSLVLEEMRAVALVEALTSRASFVFLAEPFADLDPRAVSHVADALVATVDRGATVVSSTASRTDARLFAREQLHLVGGKLVLRTTGDNGREPAMRTEGTRLFIRSEGARLLLAQLAPDPTFTEVRAKGVDLVVTGNDPIAMAKAVANASRHANVELDMFTFETNDALGEKMR